MKQIVTIGILMLLLVTTAFAARPVDRDKAVVVQSVGGMVLTAASKYSPQPLAADPHKIYLSKYVAQKGLYARPTELRSLEMKNRRLDLFNVRGAKPLNIYTK